MAVVGLPTMAALPERSMGSERPGSASKHDENAFSLFETTACAFWVWVVLFGLVTLEIRYGLLRP